jgi:hypothetical protein
MIKNKRKQRKIIEKLELLKIMFTDLPLTTFNEERGKLQKERNGEDVMSELLHSSEDAETFEERKSKKIEGILKLYNTLNEKLPEHMRQDLLE